MSRFLARAGHHGLCADSVAAAHEALAKMKPDVVLVDLMMPHESGIDFVREVRLDPRTRKLPVIIYSAVDEPEYVHEAMTAGATDYWLKSAIRPADLQDRLAAYLPDEDGGGSVESGSAHPVPV
jgi:two-component system phosphate regulon response regulator PhoB